MNVIFDDLINGPKWINKPNSEGVRVWSYECPVIIEDAEFEIIQPKEISDVAIQKEM